MDVTSSSRSRTGATAANADAARMRAQKQRSERTETADRRDNPRTARVRTPERDTYEPGAAAYVARTRMQKAPDQQRYTAHPRNDRNHPAESRRAGRA
jgi:hypothetical protein